MKIVLPKKQCLIQSEEGPLFFLAGPVRGGGDWQQRCCMMIRNLIPNFYAVLPCRYPESHPLRAFELDGEQNAFDRQLVWERHYLNLAATSGCILF